jgi:hypothetical protein
MDGRGGEMFQPEYIFLSSSFGIFDTGDDDDDDNRVGTVDC